MSDLAQVVENYKESPSDESARALADVAVKLLSGGNKAGIISIPALRSELTLLQPWVFSLFYEYRNDDFAKKIDKDYSHITGEERWSGSQTVVIPAGTKLTVDRIYIRKGGGGFDSVTFRIKKGSWAGGDKKKYGRFWAKLFDVNRIVCEWNEETMKRDFKGNILYQLAAVTID